MKGVKNSGYSRKWYTPLYKRTRAKLTATVVVGVPKKACSGCRRIHIAKVTYIHQEIVSSPMIAEASGQV